MYRLEKKSGPKYDFFEQSFRKWVDCVEGIRLRNSEDWFRYFLQRGFIETYGAGPDERTIENSVDGLLVSLLVAKNAGPYKKAGKEYKKYKSNGPRFQKYIGKPEYLKYYSKAVELTGVYIEALYKAYRLLKEGKDFADKRKWFLEVVCGPDLACPLETGILEKAKSALTRGK